TRKAARWLVRDLLAAPGEPGSRLDPRCNGAPSGTVKATIRFFSATSGHDSGPIGLPCENWIGPECGSNRCFPHGYTYTDEMLEKGPCRQALLSGGIFRAACGKNRTHVFPYDLEEGTDEGTVHVILQIATGRWCTSFPGPPGLDGSNGMVFRS